MSSKNFGELVVGDVFAYGSKVYTKRLGVSAGVDYNAEEAKSGDYWQFESGDVVFFIRKEEVKQEEVAHA